MIRLTPDRLAELRRVAEAATPGPLWEHRSGNLSVTGCTIKSTIMSQRPDHQVVADSVLPNDAKHFVTFDRETVLSLLDRIEVLEAKEPASLNELAAECHELAAARGKYPKTWTHAEGARQMIGECREWLAEFELGNEVGAKREFGDILHAVLSVGHHMGYDVEAALHGAMRRNAERAGEGV